jgi:serine/threonine protein kinase
VTKLAASTESESGGVDPLEAAHARVGSLLDAKWQLDALLGRGGMATVYAATNRATRARVAVKVLLPEFATDVDVRERFVREARIANSIQHPARVAVLDEGLSDRGEIFLVMELLEGTTLDVHVRDKMKTLSVEQKLAFFGPVLEVLGECHAAGIVHRDIKPANIFVTTSGQVKVLDFGIARLREGKGAVEATKQGTVLGTPAYMAPEQALGLSDLLDGRADLWSVGACIYAVLSGRRVHRARTENESMVLAATRSAESIALVMPDLPVEVVSFVDRSLAHDKADRFPDARAMRGALGTLIAAIQAGQVTIAKPAAGDAVVVRTDVSRDEEAEASTEVRSRTLEMLKSIWKHLAHFLSASSQYGAGHSLARQPMRVALEEIGASLASRPDSLVWDVGPFAFTYAKTPLWDGEKLQMERAAFRVFSHGMRKVQLKPGVTEDEIRRFLAIITGNPAAGVLLTDDPVADIWAQRFDHIGHVAIDVFASGTAEEIESFERELADVAAAAADVSMVAQGSESGSDPLEARALQANLLLRLNTAASIASGLAVDAQARMLGGQISLPMEEWDERFAEVLVAALLEGTSAGDADPLLEALDDWTSAAVTRNQIAPAFQRFARLGAACARGAAEAASEAERLIAKTMFGPARFAEILAKVRGGLGKEPGVAPKVTASPAVAAAAAEAAANLELVAAGVVRVVELMEDGSFFDGALAEWVRSQDPRIAAALLAYAKRWAAGHEASLGAILEQEMPEFSLTALEVLKAANTSEAQKAILRGLRSAFPAVRRAALHSLEGEEGQADLVRLLGDPEVDLRCEVLGIIAKLRLRAVGPTVVRRIQDPAFQALDGREKREWLTCLQVLNAARAEEIVIEMLDRAPFFANEANDRNRLLAAQVLAGADTQKALAAAKKAARGFWWNSPAVREAAEAAVAAISSRRDAAGGGDK